MNLTKREVEILKGGLQLARNHAGQTGNELTELGNQLRAAGPFLKLLLEAESNPTTKLPTRHGPRLTTATERDLAADVLELEVGLARVKLTVVRENLLAAAAQLADCQKECAALLAQLGE